ncbi:hypothetical protein CE91St43_04120 [Oscillospiraceae bacterium]|nr:hypothetical protein CE91St43_04120 [Oscillospiraceae bacterium]
MRLGKANDGLLKKQVKKRIAGIGFPHFPNGPKPSILYKERTPAHEGGVKLK